MLLGIDAGTAWARAAFLDLHGRPQMFCLVDGGVALPVYARRTLGGIEVGRSAMLAQAGNSETTVAACTRLMGRPALVPTTFREKLPYSVHEEAGEIVCDLLHEEVAVTRLYGLLVRSLVDAAQTYLDEEVDGVVLTVPASAEDRFRIQAKLAVERQGIGVIRLVNRPAAALRAANFGNDVQCVAAVNCGGYAFEISIAERRGHGWQILASAGNQFAGVDDLLWRVAEGMRILNIGGWSIIKVLFCGIWEMLRHGIPDYRDSDNREATIQFSQVAICMEHHLCGCQTMRRQVLNKSCNRLMLPLSLPAQVQILPLRVAYAI